jgi:hypothetical protein
VKPTGCNVADEKVNQHYKCKYDLTPIATTDVTDGLKGHAAKVYV